LGTHPRSVEKSGLDKLGRRSTRLTMTNRISRSQRRLDKLGRRSTPLTMTTARVIK
jgi:hypothetical protein